jgi:type VI protein secretion system component VasA
MLRLIHITTDRVTLDSHNKADHVTVDSHKADHIAVHSHNKADHVTVDSHDDRSCYGRFTQVTSSNMYKVTSQPCQNTGKQHQLQPSPRHYKD